MKTLVLAPKCKELEICHSHPHNKEKSEQTENQQCFLESSEN